MVFGRVITTGIDKDIQQSIGKSCQQLPRDASSGSDMPTLSLKLKNLTNMNMPCTHAKKQKQKERNVCRPI